MDTEEDAREYAGIDNTSVNEKFVAAALGNAPASGRLLDVGAGPGDIAVAFARHRPELEIVAIDLGEHMLRMAQRTVVRSGLSHRVTIMRADAKATGFEGASFDCVVSNSVVHHIPDPAAFFAEMLRVARPGAGFFVKDLHRPASTAELTHLVETYASDCSPYQRRLFAQSLHAALTAEEVSSMCRRLGLEDIVVRRCSDRHWSLERRAQAPRRVQPD
ncbi:MAG TPA: methyltransferase domain-containing protein [Nevskia sp.]|nr:methyltransferase domain-containing protein [Nevskia sp.]